MELLAFVGLGAMGSPMAKRLVGAGFEVKVFDVLDERTRPLIELGAVSAASLGEAAEDTEALVVMVANAEQAEGVLFGEGGAAEALPEGATVVVMSTIGPEAVRELADALSERGLRTLDAPVSGGVARAEKGDLLIMAGGSEGLFEKLRPALEAMGSDPRFAFETIRHGAANSFMLEDRGERMLNEEFVPPKSALDIFVKDMGLVRKAAEERGFETTLSSAALELYLAGKEAGLGREDDSGVIRVFRQQLGWSK